MEKIKICGLSIEETYVNNDKGFYAKDEQGNYIKALKGKITFKHGEKDDSAEIKIPLDDAMCSAITSLCLDKISTACESQIMAFKEASKTHGENYLASLSESKQLEA